MSFANANLYHSELGGTVHIPVNLSSVSGLPVTVNYTVEGTSTATDLDDYTDTTNTSITIPA